ncbi:copper resistance protein NlpE [Shewanella marisflavi]|uniref:copper resistance protein NlpE n=1 Tax=Shewanella marisflavi TaxID=260364 RepID=UPI001E31A599|nr:copper resistance protein NlpE [Shewanella marisflavi]
MKIAARLLPMALLALSACAQQTSQAPEPQAVKTAEIPIGDTSRNALDWPGLYTGTLPCADCQGIALRLQINADYSYQLSQVYLGKSDKQQGIEQQGQFRWNGQGNKIILDDKARGMQLQVGENILFMLDEKGERIKGALAQQYQLRKSN